MSRKLVKFITITIFALPLVVYSAALANSTQARSGGSVMNDGDGYLQCIQTLNDADFCTARFSSPTIRVAHRESHACMQARRNIARYGQVLADLDATLAKHRHAASIYRQARSAEAAWYKQRC